MAAPTARASALAVTDAEAVGADLPGVEILHRRSADVVLELDTAVAFTTDYSLPCTDVFDLVARRARKRKTRYGSISPRRIA